MILLIFLFSANIYHKSDRIKETLILSNNNIVPFIIIFRSYICDDILVM